MFSGQMIERKGKNGGYQMQIVYRYVYGSDFDEMALLSRSLSDLGNGQTSRLAWRREIFA